MNAENSNPSYRSQVKGLRALALDAIRHYPFKIKNIEFIKYSANAIFRVTDTQNKQYALRINPEKHHAQQAILEEILWMNHILETTDLIIPTPIKTLSNHYCIEESHPSIPGSRVCLLFEWLPGKKKWKSINENYANNLGELIAKLHHSGLHLKMQHRNYWLADGLVGAETATFYNVEKLSDVTNHDQQIITSARRVVHTILKDQEQKHLDKTGTIHSDTQPNNILVNQGKFSIIDFDECGMGFYNDDLAVALCAFEHVTEGNPHKSFHLLKTALLDGYSKYMPLSEEDIRLLPYFMLARKLVTIAWLEAHKINPNIRDYFPIAIDRAVQSYQKIIFDY